MLSLLWPRLGARVGAAPSAAVLPPLPSHTLAHPTWSDSERLLLGASWEPSRKSLNGPRRGYCGAGREQGCLSHLDPLKQKGPRVLASNSTADSLQFLLGSCCVHVPSQAQALHSHFPAHAPSRNCIPRTPHSQPRTGF